MRVIFLHVALCMGVLACAGGGPPPSESPSSASPGAEPRDPGPVVAARAPCIAAVSAAPPASHNAGANCISSGCHDGSEPKATRWTVAGTLYADVPGSAPAAGASIEIVDAKGLVLLLPTAADGSFHTTDPVTQPLKVRASRCPNDAPMLGKVHRVESCNQSNCHSASMRMHLP